ncbi:pyridoxal phosphate-dependent transferase [Lanmaoa asiatica]|nr:pyridoxal phosphate-dependent transferase [Lanmaoa asiatica]
MSQASPLLDSLQQAIADRAEEGMTIFSLDEPLPSHAPDFFSNDYLSLSTDHSLRDIFLRKVQAAAPTRLLGSTGSRLATGNSLEFNALETALKHFFGAPSALLFGSGFSANLTFLATVPQKGDVIIHDELIHSSCREGIRLSSRTSYRFAHNSIASFKECLLSVLQKHPQITRGTSTVFVVVESLYSMDGDFCPLAEIVELMQTLVPIGHAHIVVDEAHTSGICWAKRDWLRQRLNRLSRYAHQRLLVALRNVPGAILALNKYDATAAVSDRGLCSPVIPMFTPCAGQLADYLLQRGHAVSPITYPAVRRPRIRVIIHAGNTEEEIDSFINELLTWAERQVCVFPPTGSTSSSAGAGEASVEARARL